MTNEKATRASEKLLSKLQDAHASMEQALQAPQEVLELLVTAVSKGEEPTETWELLHAAAARDSKIQELAYAYENMAADKRIRLLSADQQAYIYLWAVHFFGGQFGDPEGALTYGQRALAVDPSHGSTLEALEYFLADSPIIERLGPLYLKAAQNEGDPAQRLTLLQRAAELVAERPPDDDLAKTVYELLLSESPQDFSAREALAARFLQMRQPHEAAKLFEQALEVTPPLDPEQQRDIRERLIDMYQTTLGQPERALPHVEGLLQVDPTHATALAVAESLQEHRTVGLRATAALSDAYEASGKTELAIGMLNVELSRVRGPRRVEVGRRLAIYRQDVLGDPAGALELLGPVIAGDPGNDEMRRRFVSLSLGLNQTQQAARLLSRALATTRDPAVRARVAVDVGEVFLQTGDARRAEIAFQQAIETKDDPQAALKAARRLLELSEGSDDARRRATVLSLLVEHEPEKERRQAAARRLAKLADTELQDAEMSIIAYRALLGSPYSDEALQRLEALYETHASPEGMAEVLAYRADRTKDPEEAKKLALQAAELRSQHSSDHAAALAAWRGYVEKYGPSRKAYERMLPLLDELEDYEGLAEALRALCKLMTPEEAAPALARLGRLEMEFLGEARAAVDSFRQALDADPGHAESRAALEQLILVKGLETLVASVLEPIYRAEGNSLGMVKLLQAKAGADIEPRARLAALADAATLAEEKLGDAELALDVSGEALLIATETQPELIGDWLERVQSHAKGLDNPRRLSGMLQAALADRQVDSAELSVLATATGDALANADDVEGAVAVYKRALSFERTPELVERVNQLLVQQGTPAERLELYESSLAAESDPTNRAALLQSIGELKYRELGDHEGAISAYRSALSEAPDAVPAALALVDVLLARGETDGAYAELEQVLPKVAGEQRQTTVARLAELASKSGSLQRALEHYKELLAGSAEPVAHYPEIEAVAEQLNDGEVIHTVLSRRLAAADDAAQKLELLERAGHNALERLADEDAAARYWQEAANLADSELRSEERAVRLHERVLSLRPDSASSASRLIALYAAQNQWDKLPVPFMILRKTAEPEAVASSLASLEEPAIQAGAGAVFVELADALLAQNGTPNLRGVALARLRVLGTDSARYSDVAAAYKTLIEAGGDAQAEGIQAFEQFLERSSERDGVEQDKRWLFEFKAEQADDPEPIWMAWAEAEEKEFGSIERAASLYERVVERSPQRTEALTELARLKAVAGDAEGALASLEALRERSEGPARDAVDLSIAKLLMDPLGRPKEALAKAAEYMQKAPADPEALDLARRALDYEESRIEAAKYLENAADVFKDPGEKARVLEVLLSISEDSEDLRAARGRWLKGLLAIKSEDPEGSLAVALRAAEQDPGDDELWGAAERFARRLNQPDAVALAYSRVINRELSPELADTLGQRIVEFYEEWFEDNQRVVELLRRVLALSPAASWAFDRLKLEFNATGQWHELFALYDAALEHAQDDSQRTDLLREVSMAAKDFANDADKAIGYLEQLHKLNPKDERVEAALERLYERNQRYRPLIGLLEARLPEADAAETLALTERMARLWMELEEPIAALDLVQSILERGKAERVVDLLENLVNMPASRDSMTPAEPENGSRKARRKNQRLISVRERASQHLRTHYQEIGNTQDVVRMLTVSVETAQDDAERVKRLRQIVKVRLNELEDSAGAFDNVCYLVTLQPEEQQYRKLLHQLAERLMAHDRQAELLVNVGNQAEALDLKISLLSEAAQVYQEQLQDAGKSIELYLQVLDFADSHPEAALAAARQLDPMLAWAERFAERCTVLEQLAVLETDSDAARAACGEAARVAFEELNNADRSIKNWNARLEKDASDIEALDGLVLAYTSAEYWDDLVHTLTDRSKLQTDPVRKRSDLVSVARVHVERRADVPAAIEAWRRVYALVSDDGEAFDALVSLLTHEERWTELADLLEERAKRENDPELQAQLNRQLGEVHRSKTLNAQAALDAFVRARDWQRAIEVAGSDQAEQETSLAVCRSLREQAVNVWLAAPDSEEQAAQAAQFAVGELSRRLLAEQAYSEVVELLLKAAELPFEDQYCRRLRQQAAFLCADQLGDAAQAIEVFRGLFSEDPADEVAQSSVERQALLFEAQALFEDLVGLWEQQAECQEAANEPARAADLWTLAGRLTETHLAVVERAMSDYRRGAALAGEDALEALARLHAERDEPLEAAQVLEWLCAQSDASLLAGRALRLAEEYLKAQRPKVARARLEQFAELAAEPAPIRKRLAELYRDAKKFTPLAALLTQEAKLARGAERKLSLLKEAARLHAQERKDPNSAVPLLSEAVELDPDSAELRLSLADALRRAERYPEAIEVLRAQVERYGARRPKKRAIVHYRLGLVCIAANMRSDALEELAIANKIDPAHPGVSQALARLAFEEGDLDRAERMYRSLLLVLHTADSDDAPSRATALLDLSEIARTKGDNVRAEEFEESAFEAAQEHESEARALEAALKQRGRVDLLARALETTLKENLPAGEAARALGNLVELALEGHVANLDKKTLQRRVESVFKELKAEDSTDSSAWTSLSRVYDYLGQRDKEALILEQQVKSWAEQGELPENAEPYYRLAAARLADEATRAQGIELLEQALSIDNDVQRADSLLREALSGGAADARSIRLFERIARSAKNKQSLLEALTMAAPLPDTGIKLLREGIALAEELGDRERKQLILERGAARDEGSLEAEAHAWVLMELAQVREDAGDVASAYDLRETAADRLPADEQRALLLAVAQAARSQGALARAARVLERLRAREPQDREVWEPLLDVYRELEDGEHIARLLEETVPLIDNPLDRSQLRLEQANVVLNSGDEDGAIQILRDTLEEDPRHLEAAETLTSLLKRTGRTTELADLLRVQLDAAKDRQKVDSIVAASMQLGQLLETKEHHRDASDVYRAVLDWDQRNKDALRGVVRMAELTNDSYAIADAIEALLKVEDPEPATQLVKRLIELRKETNDAEGVERALELAVHANPLDVEQREALVERYRARGDHSQAAALLERALELSPDESDLTEQVIASYRDAGKLEEALAALDRLLSGDQKSPDLLRQRADLKRELGDLQGALQDQEQAYALDPSDATGLTLVLEQKLAHDPDDMEALLTLVEVLQLARELDKAREHLRTFVQRHPHEKQVLVKLAELDRAANDFGAAVASLNQLVAVEQGEALVPLALELARVADKAGVPGEARLAIERALDVVPGHPELSQLLRQMYEAIGAHRELAKILMEEAEQCQDNEEKLRLLVSAAGYLVEEDGEAENAVAVLEQARSISPQDLDVATLLARAHSMLGRRHEGLLILEEAAAAQRGRRVKGLVDIYVEMANIYQEGQASREALQALTKAHELDLKNPHLAMRLGRMALDQGEEQLALRAFRSVTIMKPSEELPAEDVSRMKSDAHYHLALLAQRQGDVRKARILCSKAISENSSHEDAAALLAALKA